MRSITKASAIDIASFVAKKHTPYKGNPKFLMPATQRTKVLLDKINELKQMEQKRGVLDVDPKIPSSITAFKPGYITTDIPEIIKGLQTDAPLKRAIKPFGGINMVKAALEAYNYTPDAQISEIFTKYRKTHNSGVFDVYTPEMKAARKAGILTGLPDGYGRGRIIGDYRRVALFGVDALIKEKQTDLKNLSGVTMDEGNIRLREEVAEQIKALKELKEMAMSYGDDISKPAPNAKAAVQWVYYAYLAAVKEQDGAAMSLGRVDAFFDIYFCQDLENGTLTEYEAQEIIDDFVLKLRIIRQLRTPEYNALFAGDPTWVTISLGGIGEDGESLVNKTSYRFLNTLYTLGAAPEPNITILWHEKLPIHFKEFCAKVSIDTSSIQYENDKLMSQVYGTDYAIACCVSAMRIGKDMQYFGARSNLPKLLLYVLNQGRDEISGEQVGPNFKQIAFPGKPLNYYEVLESFEIGMDWLTKLYCNTMNIIHYMHDKYNYERIQMALHDTYVKRLLAFGISGLSVVTDSLSAIKHAKVIPIIDNTTGLVVDFEIEGDFPKFGNDDERVDSIATYVVREFSTRLSKQKTYRDSVATLSILTITSNVVYGSKTGSTPDGRKRGQPYSPGANPFNCRDNSGAIASLNSVAKLPYEYCLDGISNTFSMAPQALGKTHI